MLISSKELLWFRFFVQKGVAQAVIASAFGIYFVALFVQYSASRRQFIFNPSVRVKNDRTFVFVLLAAVATCLYFLLHELWLDDSGRSIKYCIYWFFFLTLLTKNVEFDSLAKWVVWMTGAMSIALILQAFLLQMGFEPTSFQSLSPENVDGRTDDIYFAPFGLGIVAHGNLVKYGPFSFYRASSFATEPKYCSLVLWAGLLAWLYLRACGKRLTRLWVLFLLGGFFICHAYVSAGVLFVGYLVRWVGRRSGLLGVVGVLVPSILVSVYLLSENQWIFSGYLAQRISAFLGTTIAPIREVPFGSAGLLGLGFDSPISSARVPSVALHLIRYGYIGLFLHLVVLLFFLHVCVRNLKLPAAKSMVFGLAFGVVFTYLFLFMPEPITPLFGFIFALVFHLNRQKGGAIGIVT